jgi:hypothetical protein
MGGVGRCIMLPYFINEKLYSSQPPSIDIDLFADGTEPNCPKSCADCHATDDA